MGSILDGSLSCSVLFPFFLFSSFSNMIRKKGPALFTLSLGQGIFGKLSRQYWESRGYTELNAGLGKEALLYTLTTVGKS